MTGQITGFPKPHIRSGWADPIGKLLTDRRIEHYRKQGFYGQNGILALQKQEAVTKHEKKQTKAQKLKKILKMYV